MLQKLRTVIYHVSDLQKAKDWYIKATGITPYFDEPFYVGFNIDGCEFGLDPSMENIKEGNRLEAYWAVDNVQQAADHFIQAGATLVQAVTNVGGPTPFGNNIDLIQGA
jgi:predicted enzyme related to lactoylglutathione lyase